MKLRGLPTVIVVGTIACGLVAWGVLLSRELTEAGRGLVETTALAAQMSTELETTRADADLLVQTLGVLRADDVRRIELRAPGRSTPATGRIFAAGRGFVLLTDRLPGAGGRIYQVWIAVAGAGPTSAGTFAPNPFGMATMVSQASVPPDATVTVTDEPAGGSLSPTSPPVLTGR